MAEAIKVQGTLLEIKDISVSPVAWRTVAGIESFGGPDGEASEIDITDMQSEAMEYLMGLPDEGKMSLGGNASMSDQGQQLMREHKRDQSAADFRLTFADGSPATVLTFSAFVLGYQLDGAK